MDDTMTNLMDDKITILEAYRAMFLFLEKEWETTGQPDELGSLLGGMSTLEDSSTADPAIWPQWLEAVGIARRGTEEMTARRLSKPN